MTDERPEPRIAFWALVLGGAGFAAGFFGPMLLNPDANQGPMVGIFITGPGGALLGVAVGALMRVLPVRNALRYRVLAVTTAVMVVVSLYLCLPPPEMQGVLVDGTVASCQPPAELADTAIRDWQKTVAATTWARPREGWRDEVPGMLRDNAGVVLTIDVRRQNRVLRHRKPWDAGRLTAEGWRATALSTRYFADFAGNSCDSYPAGQPLLYVRYGQGTTVWPPADLPNFLGLAQIEPATPDYIQLAARPLR